MGSIAWSLTVDAGECSERQGGDAEGDATVTRRWVARVRGAMTLHVCQRNHGAEPFVGRAEGVGARCGDALHGRGLRVVVLCLFDRHRVQNAS